MCQSYDLRTSLTELGRLAQAQNWPQINAGRGNPETLSRIYAVGSQARPHPGPTAVELGQGIEESSEMSPLSSRRGRRGLGRGGPACLRLALLVTIGRPLSPALSPLVPRGEREKIRALGVAHPTAVHPGPLPPGRARRFSSAGECSPFSDFSQHRHRWFPLLGERVRVRASLVFECIITAKKAAKTPFLLRSATPGTVRLWHSRCGPWHYYCF
jgi:hypothetical protein